MATATTPRIAPLDKVRAEEFAGRMLGVLNSGTLCLLMSIGHRTGLFDTLADLPASTSESIARASGMNERYVREWLNGMAAGGVVVYDPATRAYALPTEHGASLTRAAGTDNIAMITQYVSLLGNVEEQIVDCFRAGGGVPYSAFPRFQRLQAEETARLFDAALLDRILPLVPELPDRLRSGIDVFEVGCGYGHALNLMARAFPRSTFAGLDISAEAIEVARFEAARWGLANVEFEVKDATELNGSSRYGLITAFDTIHDQAQPTTVLKRVAGALRSGGVFLMQDIAASSRVEENLGHPLAPALYTFSLMHCMTVSLSAGGEGLGTVWGEEAARRKLAEAGFSSVSVERIPEDILNSYYIARVG
jgi:SAM-dependent methyltransferase